MTTADNSLPLTDPSDAEDSSSPMPARDLDESLRALVEKDIPQEQERLRTLVNVTPQQLAMELSGTVFEMIKELAQRLMESQAWSYEYMSMLGQHVAANDERLDVVELDQLGGVTALLPEDADLLTKVAAGLQYCASALLQGPFPIDERDEEGKNMLAELIAYAEQAQQLIAETTLTGEDEEDEEAGAESDSAEGGPRADEPN